MDEIEKLEAPKPVDRSTQKHFFWFDKIMLKIKANRLDYVPIEPTTEQLITFPEDVKRLRPLGTTSIDEILYDNCIISYQEYLNRKKK
jgi:hypothetical protein